MAQRTFADLKTFVDFKTSDVDNLHALAPVVDALLSDIADSFCHKLVAFAETRPIIKDGPQQIDKLRSAFQQWLTSLFTSDFDEAFIKMHAAIGETHSRIGVPQHFIIAAMHDLRLTLESKFREAGVSDIEAKLQSVRKLLTIELGLILETFKVHHAEEIRETERASVQERLDEVEHFAHIGHLAAALAHEIKNPLAGISGAIQVIREPMSEDHPHRPILTEVLRQIDRLDGTVKDLLVYARPRPPRFARCNLTRLIERIFTVLRSESALKPIQFEFVDSQMLDIFGDERQLEQMIMNLLLNAAHASPDGGCVKLSAASSPDGLRIAVIDEGVGMTEDVIRQAFEPFFTTKTKGTGLGLPICKKIVESHGGTIAIHSEVGKGTSVQVRLPRFPPATASGQDYQDSQ